MINHKPTLSKITSLKLTNLPQWLNLINQLLNSSNNNKITSLSLFQIWLVSTHSKCIQANRSFSCNNNNKWWCSKWWWIRTNTRQTCITNKWMVEEWIKVLVCKMIGPIKIITMQETNSKQTNSSNSNSTNMEVQAWINNSKFLSNNSNIKHQWQEVTITYVALMQEWIQQGLRVKSLHLSICLLDELVNGLLLQHIINVHYNLLF